MYYKIIRNLCNNEIEAIPSCINGLTKLRDL